MNFIKIIFIIIFALTVATLLKKIVYAITSLENYSIHKKRLKQLDFNDEAKKSNEIDTKDLIEKITHPIIEYIFPKLKIKNKEYELQEIKKKLELAGWSDIFTPIKFKAFVFFTKALAILVGLLLFPKSKPIAFMWAVPLFIVANFLLNNKVEQKKEDLLSEFPDFIRITQGYLSADMPLNKAITNTIVYVGKAWQPLLQDFVINCELYSVEEAMIKLAEATDIFEVRELMSLIKLSLEQGINLKDSFNRQAEKVRDLQLYVLTNKIAKRQTMGILIQAPLFVTLFVSFGLPTFASMTNFSTM